jgi:GTPase SAR1 family protein
VPIGRRRRKQAEPDPPVTAGKGLSADSDGSGEAPAATAVYLSPDDEHLAIVTDYRHLGLYKLNGEKLSEKLGQYAKAHLSRVAWSGSGTKLAFVNDGGKAEIVDIPSGKTTVLGTAGAVAFYPDSSRLAVLDKGSLSIWETEPPAFVREITLPAGTPSHGKSGHQVRVTLGVSPDGQRLACNTNTYTIQILDARDLRLIQELSGHTAAITDLEWMGPTILVSASLDGAIRIWDVPKGQVFRVLEGEDQVLGISHSSALDCVASWTGYEYRVWSVSTWDLLAKSALSGFKQVGYRHASASLLSPLLVTLDEREPTAITFFNGWDANRSQPPGSVSTYANAKVLMLGDSGVGKSGLALVLAGEPFRPTESTHARRIWKMPVPELNHGSEAQREVLLWDLAGQPGYRIVHQLHLSDGAVALIMFDSRSETAPLAGIGYWARALQHAQAAGGDTLPTFLVGGRTDRGVVGVSDERLSEVVAEFGFRGYLPTSAKEGWGIEELRAAVLAAIDWDRMPGVTSSALFAAAKSFVLDQKEAGTLLTPLASLLAAFLGAPVTGPAAEAVPDARVGRDLLDADSGGDGEGRLRGVFEGCVARLESAGLVKLLAFGDFVLLQPELIDVYAGAIVNAARDEPDGLGSMLESRVLDVDFRLPEQERIADRQQEKLLIIATLEELTRHEIVLREDTEDGVQLVFPAAFRRDLPEAAEPPSLAVEFGFEGPVANIYATLVVRLARSARFTLRGAWQSAAQFEADSGGICTVHLVRSDEGRGALQAGYDEGVAEVVRFQFERFVMAHLQRRAIPGTMHRTRLYRCSDPDCGVPFTAAQAEAARSRGRTSLICPIDGTKVPLEDSYDTLSQAQEAVAKEMDASADAARSIAAASSVILGKEETTDFDVFLCHNTVDKPAIRQMAQRLREHGILPWLDEAELIPGRPWQEELERQIGHIRAAAVFVGPTGFGPWQNQEMRAFLSEFIDRQCPVIPVLLPAAAVPELPVFLRRMTWVDLGKADGIERLIWGITGRKPAWSGLDQAFE